MDNMQFNRMSGIEKAAVLLLCLGETATAAVFRELQPADVRTLTRVMMGIEHIPAELASEVMMEFQNAQKKTPACLSKAMNSSVGHSLKPATSAVNSSTKRS